MQFFTVLLTGLVVGCWSYQIKDVEPRDCNGGYIPVDDTGLILTFTGKIEGFVEGQQCIFHFRNPQNDVYKHMTLLVEKLDIPGDCSQFKNFVKVIGIEGGTPSLCGHWEVNYEGDIKPAGYFDRTKQNTFESQEGLLKVIFQTGTNFENFHAVLVVTPHNDGKTCPENQFNCKANGTPHCIHQDLQCDGHFNCGSEVADEDTCGLSAGAIAGIVIGVLLGVVIICGVLYYYFVKRSE